MPPSRRVGATFGGETVGQEIQPNRRSVNGQWRMAQRTRQSLPHELPAFQSHTPFEKLAPLRVPAVPMHRHGVQQFVGKNNAVDLPRRNVLKPATPTHLSTKLGEGFFLPLLPPF